MRTQTVLCRGADVCHDVLAREKVDIRVRSELHNASQLVDTRSKNTVTHLLAHRALLLAAVDRDYSQTHRLRVLLRQTAEAAASTDDSDALSRTNTGLLETFVDCDAGAEDGGDGVEGDVFRDARDVRGFCDAVFYESCSVGARERGGR